VRAAWLYLESEGAGAEVGGNARCAKQRMGEHAYMVEKSAKWTGSPGKSEVAALREEVRANEMCRQAAQVHEGDDALVQKYCCGLGTPAPPDHDLE
jgi:hypothetical protein